MGIAVTGGNGGMLRDVHVVPLIDILLVLLVIFMIIPHREMGLQASLPQQQDVREPDVKPEAIIVVQVVSVARCGSMDRQ